MYRQPINRHLSIIDYQTNLIKSSLKLEKDKANEKNIKSSTSTMLEDYQNKYIEELRTVMDREYSARKYEQYQLELTQTAIYTLLLSKNQLYSFENKLKKILNVEELPKPDPKVEIPISKRNPVRLVEFDELRIIFTSMFLDYIQLLLERPERRCVGAMRSYSEMMESLATFTKDDRLISQVKQVFDEWVTAIEPFEKALLKLDPNAVIAMIDEQEKIEKEICERLIARCDGVLAYLNPDPDELDFSNFSFV